MAASHRSLCSSCSAQLRETGKELALIVTDDYLNHDSNIVMGNDDCDAITKGYDEHAIDFYSNVIGDYNYDAVNGTDGKYETEAFSDLIGTYGNDAVS